MLAIEQNHTKKGFIPTKPAVYCGLSRIGLMLACPVMRIMMVRWFTVMQHTFFGTAFAKSAYQEPKEANGMRDLLLIILANGLVNNVVLSRFLGLCSFMGVSNKVSSAIGMAMATTFVLTMATGVGWVIEYAVLVPLGLEYLRLLTFIMVIASLVQLTELFIAKQSPELHRTLGIFLPLITTNCAVLGIALLTIQEKLRFFPALIYGFSSALGYSLVIILFAGLRQRLEKSVLPDLFSGTPISFITAGILAMAFAGFGGLAG